MDIRMAPMRTRPGTRPCGMEIAYVQHSLRAIRLNEKDVSRLHYLTNLPCGRDLLLVHKHSEDYCKSFSDHPDTSRCSF